MVERSIVIGLPIVLLLGILVLFGVTWLFHHHHWRPFAGFFLFIIGLGVFWTLMRHSAFDEQFAPPMTQRSRAPNEIGRDQAASMRSETATGAKSTTIRTGGNGDQIVAEKPLGSTTATSTTKSPEAAPADDRSAVKSSYAQLEAKAADHPPQWLGRPPHAEQRDDGQRVYVATAASGRYATPAECERAIVPVINEIVSRYVADYVSDAPDGDLPLDAAFRNELAREWYPETVETSVGSMHQLHALLVFDARVRNELDSRARLAKVDGRLKYTAAGTLLTLLVLGGVYSLLKKNDRRPTAAAK